MDGVQVVRLQVIGDQRMLLIISKDWLYVTERKGEVVLSKKPMEN